MLTMIDSLLVQIYLRWLNLEKGRMLFLLLSTVVVLFMLLVVESYGSLGYVSSSTLLRAWLARFSTSLGLAWQVEV